ncbi:Uu.00g083780.m01.CDS01 [Anthostomella pinea]|uniref:Uu.00g083780.m01.CDS01 n=1 Tax=Anthostomella pinea TaxID=933095 RepID=A0AAI8VM89_9PEZI|nr:Uu.00g083780.m01.CDS01 [Anthostomella pinea]
MVSRRWFPTPREQLVFVVITVVLALSLWTSHRIHWKTRLGTGGWSLTSRRHATSDVFNSTLGFERVFAIGLPERSDKRDALTLMAALTGFKLSWINGVAGESVPNKALPFGWDRPAMPETNLGSWRGHINAMRHIVASGLTSALVMEDDMDWDTHLKSQLSDFASAATSLQEGFYHNQSLASPSPYGQHWDMLWIGSCATTFDEHLPLDLQLPEDQQDSRKMLIANDVTVPPGTHITGNASFSWTEYAPQTRIVYVPGDNICSFAYALSAAGARKALQYMGLEGQHKAFDNHLSDLCRLRVNGMRCVSVVPSLFVHHRPRGRVSRDSDISGGDGSKDDVREVGFTENVLYSTRLNLQNLVRGMEPERQWED